jgi:hypothetical protein
VLLGGLLQGMVPSAPADGSPSPCIYAISQQLLLLCWPPLLLQPRWLPARCTRPSCD